MNEPLASTLSFPANFEAYGRAAAELRRVLEERGVKPRPRHHAELVFEEVVSNVIRHGCRDAPECMVEVRVAVQPHAIVLDFVDNARAFDPLSHAVRDLPDTLDEAAGGGLGLRLVRKVSERLDYKRTAEKRNHFTVTIAM